MNYSFEDIIMYLDDIDSYVSFILFYHSCSLDRKKDFYLKEILMYLSCVPEIVQDIKDYLYNLYYSKD